MQLQKLFGRAQGSRCRPALSVGRRRDLAFGSFGPPSHRKGRREKGTKDSRGRKRAGSRIASAPHKGTQSEIVTAGCGWWFLLAPAARHGAEELRVEKRHQMMEGVLVCLYVELLHGKAADADSADATRFTRAPMRGFTAKQCGVRIDGAAATEASEVGSHRVAVGEELAVDWTDPPKRGRRRENAGSSGRLGKAKAHSVGKSSVESWWSERDSLGNGRARSHESRVSGWQFVGGAYLACVKGREA
jgi:hypothetical protein